MEKYLVKTVNNIEADSTGNVDGNALGFIPLTGTEVGKPVTGTIVTEAPIYLRSYDVNNVVEISDDGGVGQILLKQTDGDAIAALTINNGISFYDGVAHLQFYPDFTNNSFIVQGNSSSKGISGSSDYTPNITDLDYTQKKYVDTKASEVGADDIEITDFNKGVILTSPNSSRYRITVDNAGTLITTLI